MNIKEFADRLDGSEYGEEISLQNREYAKQHGFVIVCGASDDLMEFDGAIREELNCYDGGIAHLTEDGIFDANGDEYECECKYYQAARQACKTIEAVWCGEDEYSWTYETDIPHGTFDIYENGEKYCRGIVFDVSDLRTCGQ